MGYPGLNGSHAWTTEALGDAMLRAGKPTSQPSARKKGKGVGSADGWQPVAKEEPKEAVRLYTEARGILRLMFGAEHEYVTQVDRKLAAAQKVEEMLAEQAMLAQKVAQAKAPSASKQQ